MTLMMKVTTLFTPSIMTPQIITTTLVVMVELSLVYKGSGMISITLIRQLLLNIKGGN